MCQKLISRNPFNYCREFSIDKISWPSREKTLNKFFYYSQEVYCNKYWCIVQLPPKAVPFHTRPVTSWNGLVDISWPAAATPMITDTPQPLWQLSNAALLKPKIKHNQLLLLPHKEFTINEYYHGLNVTNTLESII